MKIPALFNPSNDMALATNVRQYFPPRRIQQMEDDLQSLARFWDNGPWGWSLATKQRYLKMGIPENELPSDAWLAEMRRLSSREFGVKYYQALLLSPPKGEEIPLIPCQAKFITDASGLHNLITSTPPLLGGGREGTLIIKAPWSSSGRGNIIISSSFEGTGKRFIERVIREQGGIVVEPFYANKTLDFAMEFEVSDKGTEFVGYSVFSADETGHYGGNLVKSQEELQTIIDLPQPFLDSLIDYHQRELSKLPYRGPVGIDMMRLADGRIQPCVEINFRMTMGLLAILLYNKGICSDQWLTPYRPNGFTASIRNGSLCICTPTLS